ncbi:MAG: acyl-CoA dehydrogenase C-terminal domain-containing protein [Desulfomonilia bacterium]
MKENREAAFYDGKIKGARYFIKNVLPEIEGTIKAIKSEDLSIMEISVQRAFASIAKEPMPGAVSGEPALLPLIVSFPHFSLAIVSPYQIIQILSQL